MIISLKVKDERASSSLVLLTQEIFKHTKKYYLQMRNFLISQKMLGVIIPKNKGFISDCPLFTEGSIEWDKRYKIKKKSLKLKIINDN